MEWRKPFLQGPRRVIIALTVHVTPRRADQTPAILPQSPRAPRPASPTPAPAAPVDSVSISDEARAHAAARDAVESAPDVRQDRVEQLRQQIADGTYKIPSSALARALLGDLKP